MSSPSRVTRALRCCAADRRSAAAFGSALQVLMLLTEAITLARLLPLSLSSPSSALACGSAGSVVLVGVGDGDADGAADSLATTSLPESVDLSPLSFLSSSPMLIAAPAASPATAQAATTAPITTPRRERRRPPSSPE
ncbi:hypothetical protein [Streptomyces buecherae]|uniref:hypothetical protein n=1 Tax=Streptomyces buecherae TaxID=2763006 RepID=UPI0036662684